MNARSLTYNFSKAIEAKRYFIIFSVAFRFILDFSYVSFVNPVFDYGGFQLDINILKYSESWFIYIFFIINFPKSLLKPSDYILSYLLFTFLAPLLSFYGLNNASREHLYIILLTIVLIYIFRLGRPLDLPLLKFGRRLAVLITVICIVMVSFWMIKNGGMRFFNLNFLLVYELRGDVGDAINQGLMAYLNVWATKVFGPLLLALALWKKNYLLSFAVILLHVFWFGISSHKSVLFYPLLVLFLWVWFNNTKSLALIPLMMSVLISFSLLVFFIFDYILIGSMFIRRVFFVPSFLTFTYFDFFSWNPHVYWSNSIFSNSFNYPYDKSTGLLIGEYLGTTANANNSFLSTGFMHAGSLGMFIYGIFVGFLLRVIDSISHKGLPTWVALSAIIIPVQSLIVSADLPTALLTHGLGIAILMLFLLRSKAVTTHTA